MNLELERGRKQNPIEMPPLPPEETAQVDQPQQEVVPSYAEASAGRQDIPQDGAALQRLNESGAAPIEESQAEPAKLERHESAQARNFRELREKAERAARERDDLAQQIKELKSQMSQKDDLNLSPDDLVEGKHLAKVLKEQQELKEQLRQYSQQRHLADAEIRLKSKYSDFDQVVNEKNILALRETNPQRAETIKSVAAHNPEEALSLAYSAIKESNLYEAPKRYDQDVAKAQQNSSKPRPLNTVAAQHTDSPISRMNAFAQGELTPEMQKQYLKEMNDSRKGY